MGCHQEKLVAFQEPKNEGSAKKNKNGLSVRKYITNPGELKTAFRQIKVVF